MTNDEKCELKGLVMMGYKFDEIRQLVSCSDSTIKRYIKVFGKKKRKP